MKLTAISKLLGINQRARPAPPGARPLAELARTQAAMVQARGREADATAGIDRLRAIIEAEPLAAHDLQRAVTHDGAASLERFAAGDVAAGDGIADLVSAAEVATRAAGVARAALPNAERALAEASAEVSRLERVKRDQVQAALIECADVIAAKYKAAFATFCELHDQLVGLDQGLSAAGFPANARMIDAPIEVPRFNLPAMRAAIVLDDRGYSRHGLAASEGETYSTFLRHVPNGERVHTASSEWSNFAARLHANPEAEVADLLKAGDAATEVRRPGLILHPPRQRNEPSVTDALYGPPAPKQRMHRVLA